MPENRNNKSKRKNKLQYMIAQLPSRQAGYTTSCLISAYLNSIWAYYFFYPLICLAKISVFQIINGFILITKFKKHLRIKHILTIWSSNTTLRYLLRRKGNIMSAKTCVHPKWKQPKCSSTDKWINILWYIHTMDYYSVTKKE